MNCSPHPSHVSHCGRPSLCQFPSVRVPCYQPSRHIYFHLAFISKLANCAICLTLGNTTIAYWPVPVIYHNHWRFFSYQIICHVNLFANRSPPSPVLAVHQQVTQPHHLYSWTRHSSAFCTSAVLLLLYIDFSRLMECGRGGNNADRAGHVWKSQTVQYATKNECYKEQFLAIKSAFYNIYRCYNERMLQWKLSSIKSGCYNERML
jgi:hypothetical protein